MQQHVASLLYLVLQAEQQRAADVGDSSEAETWRHKLHHYLDQLFQKDQTAGADYHHLQVQLSASQPAIAGRCILSR